MKNEYHFKVVAKEFNRWNKLGRAESMQREHIVAVEAAIKDMEIKSNFKILDIGCGNGYTVRLLASQSGKNIQVYGVDISEKMIQSATRLSKNYNNCHYRVADFSSLPFEDNFFNIIISVESIYYAENMLAALIEIKRILKPGGKFYCISYFYKEHKNSAAWAEHIPLKMHYLSESEYLELFNKAGFTDTTSRRIYDTRPVDKESFKPGWGYNTAEEVMFFRKHIGALLVVGSYAI